MKIKQIIISLALVIGISSILISPLVSAATCGGVDTSIIGCNQNGSGKCPDGTIYTKEQINSGKKCSDGSIPVIVVEDTGIWGILLLVINILTAGIGITAVGGVLYGSIMYASAGGSAEQTKKAKGIITNVVIGLIAYALMFAFLNFIIPGGLFSTTAATTNTAASTQSNTSNSDGNGGGFTSGGTESVGNDGGGAF